MDPRKSELFIGVRVLSVYHLNSLAQVEIGAPFHILIDNSDSSSHRHGNVYVRDWYGLTTRDRSVTGFPETESEIA